MIPAFNEVGRIERTIDELSLRLAQTPLTSRIVVVDNGSADRTASAIKTLRQRHGERLAVLGCATPGKGAAVRRGIMTSSARYVGFLDADGATDLDCLAPTVAQLQAGAAAVVGSRYHPAATIAVRQPFTRRVGGTVFRTLATRAVPGLTDTQCGFKFFRTDYAQAALAVCPNTGYAFDITLLRAIVRGGGQIVELPVRWSDDRNSRLRPLRDGVPAVRTALCLAVIAR